MTQQQMCNLGTAIFASMLCGPALIMLTMICMRKLQNAWRRFRQMGLLKRVLAALLFAGFVAWGGTKPKPAHLNVRLVREPDDTLHPAATITNIVSDTATSAEERAIP